MLGLGNSLIGGSPTESPFSAYSGSFDGSADFVLLPEVDAIAKITSALTVSLWAKPNAWDMTNGNNEDQFLGCYNNGGWYVQTYIDDSQRKNYAGVGYIWDKGKDAFIAPQPYSSWILNETTCKWEAPVAYPDDGKIYQWNEETTSWEETA